MPQSRVPKPPSVPSLVPPCSYISCGRVLEVENVAQRCRICSTAYCSRGCRKSAEKKHREICKQLVLVVDFSEDPTRDEERRRTAPESSKWSPPRGLERGVSVPFTKLDNGIWLYDRKPQDVYRILIDAYRLRRDDGAAPDEDTNLGSVDGGPSTGIPAFRVFVDLVNSRDGLMPSWWRDSNRVECEKMALQTEEARWHQLSARVDENLIKEHYQDETFPTQLRIFAEWVYGTAVGRQSTEGILREMVFWESLRHSFVAPSKP